MRLHKCVASALLVVAVLMVAGALVDRLNTLAWLASGLILLGTLGAVLWDRRRAGRRASAG